MTDTNLVLYIVSSVAIMVTLTAGVIIFFHVSQRKIQAEKLEKQELKTKFQHELLEKTVATQETERSRIARELHDDIGSKLSVIHLNLHLIKEDGKKGNNIDTLVEEIQSSLQKSIEASRNLSHGLMPPTLHKFGVQAAIEDLQRDVNKTGEVKMMVNALEECSVKDDKAQLHLFRISQELVQNALKHAKASAIYFTFTKTDHQLTLVYEDDGVGFPKDIDLSSGLGLSNLQTRLQLLNGQWQLDRERNKGTKIEIQIPL